MCVQQQTYKSQAAFLVQKDSLPRPTGWLIERKGATPRESIREFDGRDATAVMRRQRGVGTCWDSGFYSQQYLG